MSLPPIRQSPETSASGTSHEPPEHSAASTAPTPGLSEQRSGPGTGIHEREARIKPEPDPFDTWSNNNPLFNPSDNLDLRLLPSHDYQFDWAAPNLTKGKSRQQSLIRKALDYIRLTGHERKEWIESRVREEIYQGSDFPSLAGQKELRAKKELARDEIIGHYAGKVYTREGLGDLQERYGAHQVHRYLNRVMASYFISALEHGNAMALINACKTYSEELPPLDHPEAGSSGQGTVAPNVAYLPVIGNKQALILIVSLRKISPDETLWADYGESYWKYLYEVMELSDESDSDTDAESPLSDSEVDAAEPLYDSEGSDDNSLSGMTKAEHNKAIFRKIEKIKNEKGEKSKEYFQCLSELLPTLKLSSQRIPTNLAKLAFPDNGTFCKADNLTIFHMIYMAWKTGSHPQYTEKVKYHSPTILKLLPGNNPDYKILLQYYFFKRLDLGEPAKVDLNCDNTEVQLYNIIRWISKSLLNPKEIEGLEHMKYESWGMSALKEFLSDFCQVEWIQKTKKRKRMVCAEQLSDSPLPKLQRIGKGFTEASPFYQKMRDHISEPEAYFNAFHRVLELKDYNFNAIRSAFITADKIPYPNIPGLEPTQSAVSLIGFALYAFGVEGEHMKHVSIQALGSLLKHISPVEHERLYRDICILCIKSKVSDPPSSLDTGRCRKFFLHHKAHIGNQPWTHDFVTQLYHEEYGYTGKYLHVD